MNIRLKRVPDTRTFVALFVFLCALSSSAIAQTDSSLQKTSLLRGTVTVTGSGLPVIGARIKVMGTKLGAISSATGEYRIKAIPVGHYVVRITSQGYTEQTNEILVESAHQAVLDFALQEWRGKADTAVVYASALALTPVNPNALSRVTPFSIEDVKRYAAGFEDPSRMAQNFAGVV